MAGKRQHYIPQSLQRGFVSHWRGKEAYTWVYRKDSEPFETNVKNAAVQKEFYTDNEGAEADTEITQQEDEYGTILNQLRSHSDIAAVGSEKLAELVAHLEIRTRSLRESFKSMGGFVADQFFRILEKPGKFEEYLRQELARDPTFLDDSISSQLGQQGFPQAVIDEVLSNRDALLDFALPQIRDNLAQTARGLRAELPGILEKSAKTGHVSALKKAVAPDSKIRRYRQLHFSVIDTGDVSIPLGDSITVFLFDAGESASSFSDGSRTLDCVLVPISAKQVLLGRSTEYSPPAQDLPRIIARVSLEQFIAAENTPHYRSLAEEIGEDSDILSTEELFAIVHSTLGDSDPTSR